MARACLYEFTAESRPLTPPEAADNSILYHACITLVSPTRSDCAVDARDLSESPQLCIVCA